MTQMESPKRKMQKKNDYQRHKLFRKIKRRRKAQVEAEQHIAEKQLRKKLKLPKFGDGKEKVNLDNAHFDKEGNLVDNNTGVKYIPTSDDVIITPNTKYFYDPYSSAGNYFDGNWSKDFINMTPGIGDAMDVAQSIVDSSNGKYIAAGSGLAMLALPNFIEKPFKYIGKRSMPFIKRYLDKINFKGFKSELDWSPESWLSKRIDKKWTKKDEDALASHLQEYLDIEKKAKQNGTWLKNKDGSTFDGDPRSWVQMQSDSFKKSYNDEILTHGEDAINDLFGDFYGDGVGTGIGDKVLWTSTNKLLGKTYGNDVFSLAALKNAKTNVVADAEGRPWSNVVQGKDTNNLVYPNLTNDNIVRINNVVDAGPNIKWSEIKDFRKNETVPEYLSRKYTGDDVVIGQDVSRKSIVGNNGDFNPIDKNIYRALIPLIGTYGLYDINKYNYNSGKDIRIKPSKRGTFTKAAKQHGISVQSFANRVLINPSKYSADMRKKANFAHNASKWNK